MKRLGWVLALGLSACALEISGCALTSKADALSIRYFTPESTHARLTSTSQAQPSGKAIEIGRVSSGLHLREKMAYRDDAFEVGYYDDRRWTERPEVFVRRSLGRTLYEDHGMKRTLAGQSPVLDVELLAFEEIKSTHSARVSLHILVHDNEKALVEKTVLVDRAITATGPEGVVRAMAEALDAACEEIAGLLIQSPT